MRLATRVLVAGCTGLLGLTPIGTSTATAPEPARRVLQAQADAVVAAGVPGVVVEVRDERGTWTGISGVADITTNAPPHARGRVRIGSVTKSFTATLVLQLVAEGRIELDVPIQTYLPGLLPYHQPITVRDLLQHRSGLFEYGDVVWPRPYSKAIADRRFWNYTPTQLVHIATQHPLQVAPGTEFFYSNTDYIVLGILIEKTTGHSVSTELVRRILRPAGLRNTYLAGSFPFLAHPAMRGYEALGEANMPLSDLTTYSMSVSWTTGAIVSTAADVNRFYRALLTGKLLPAAQLTQMQQTVPAFPGFGYGLGLAGAELCGRHIWGHVGSVPGYETYSFISADAERQVTVTVNRGLTVQPAVDEAITALVATVFC